MGRTSAVKAVPLAPVDETDNGAAAHTGLDARANVPEIVPTAGTAGPPAEQPEAPGAAATPPARRRRSVAEAERRLVRGDVPAWQRALRYGYAQLLVRLYGRLLFRLRLEGRENLADGPALYCFNHLSWMDPLAMVAVFPSRPRLYFYGPKEDDLRKGAKNRLMWWSGIAVPFSPNKDDLITSVRRAQAVFESGGALAISGEGRIHVHEGDLLPFQEGAAYLALRARVPIVPVAITGTSWARFRGEIRIRIGEPIETGPRPTRDVVAAYTARIWHAVRAMVADDVGKPPPSAVERWFTDLFNDWGPGGRAAATEVRGPRPDEVHLPAGLGPR